MDHIHRFSFGFQFQNGQRRKFLIVGRYSFLAGTKPKQFHTRKARNRALEHILNNSRTVEIWKSIDEKIVVIYSWTDKEYEKEIIYFLNAETEQDDDWKVFAIMENDNNLKVTWTSRTGKEEEQVAHYEFTRQGLIITIIATMDEVARVQSVVAFRKKRNMKKNSLDKELVLLLSTDDKFEFSD